MSTDGGFCAHAAAIRWCVARPARTVDYRAGNLGRCGRRRLCGGAGHGRTRCAQPRVHRAGPDAAHRDRQSHRRQHNRSRESTTTRRRRTPDAQVQRHRTHQSFNGAPSKPAIRSDLGGLPAGPVNRALSRHAIDSPPDGVMVNVFTTLPACRLREALANPGEAGRRRPVWPLLRLMRRSSSRLPGRFPRWRIRNRLADVSLASRCTG